MENKYLAEIQNAADAKIINSYMLKKLINAVGSGINDGVFQEILSDAQSASDAGVNSDKEYNQYFYLRNFAEDMLKDTFNVKLQNNEDRQNFCKFCLNEKDKFDLGNLTDLRILAHKWLCGKLNKNAYPNIGGKYTRSPVYDINKWALTFKSLWNLVNVNGLDRKLAFDDLTKEWDEEEKFNFENWIKYYEEKNAEKYNVKTAKFIKEAFGPVHVNLPESLLVNRTPTAPQLSTFQAQDHKTQKEMDMDKAKALKTKMKSRIRALKILVDKYNDVLPHQDLDKLFSEVNSLEKSISKLNVHASLEDCIIRSANRMTKLGFSEGAEILLKEADDTAPAQKVEPSPSDTPNLPAGSSAAVNVQSIITRLEGVNNRLASRDLIRELAAVDILLNELGLASYFPELSLAQSKLIEAFGYANNKVEDVIARLRGTGTSKPVEKKAPETAPLPVAPPVAPVGAAPAPVESIKTEELMGKPVSKVQNELPAAAPAPAKK